MSLREAAQMALQALVETQQSRAFTQGVPDAINALRAALAEADDAELRAALTDLKAWKDAVHDALVINWTFSAEHEDNPRKAVADLIAAEVRIALDPLYTHPPAPQPVELSDDKILRLWGEHTDFARASTGEILEFARAVLAQGRKG